MQVTVEVKMQIYKNTKSAFFDCDSTLVMWEGDVSFEGKEKSVIEIKCPYDNGVIRLLPHSKHVQMLIGHARTGWSVVVWSAGGWEWAEAVVKALGVEQYVDIVMSKPVYAYDDLPLSEAVGVRRYFPFEDLSTLK